MARLLGPDANSRLVYTITGRALHTAAGLTATVYSAATGSTLADIATYDGTATPGATISGSLLTVDGDSLLPLFWFPDGIDTVYVSVNGGTRVAVNADYDARLDSLASRVTAMEAGGTADALLLHKAGAETVTGIKTFSASPIVPTPSASTEAANKTYADARETAAVASSAQRAANLSDLASASAARTNLGAVGTARQVLAGSGLAGGGDLSADRTLTVASYNYVGIWAASTAYALNDLVTGPTGDVVTPKVAFTSGSSYSASNWNVVTPAAALTRHDRRGNRVSWLGDSITIGNSTFTATSTLRGDKDPLNWLHLLTDGKAVYQTNAGVSGNTTTQMLARTTDVTTPGADWCLVMGGTNDCSSGINLATYASNIRAIVAALIVANIAPVLVTPPPKTITGANRQTLETYVQWLQYYAYHAGIPLVDGWSTLIDPTTGNMQSAYDNGDGIHPNVAGAKALGQAVANTFGAMLNPVLAQPPAHQTSDSRNMIAGGLFLVDTNADGVSDSWTKTGSGTASRVTGDTAILGTWQRLVDTVNEFTQITSTSVSTGFSVGDRLAFTGLVKSGTTSGQVNVQLVFTNASPSVNIRPISGLTTSVTAHRFYLEYVVPSGTTAIQVSVSSQSGTGMDIQVAQIGVFNLTTLGIDTA